MPDDDRTTPEAGPPDDDGPVDTDAEHARYMMGGRDPCGAISAFPKYG